MILPGAADAVGRLLGRSPDEITTLVEGPDHGVYRVDIAGEFFVVKIDRDHQCIAREVAGQSRAAEAGVPVPAIVAQAPGAFAMRFVAGASLDERPSAPAWRATGHALRTLHAAAPAAPAAPAATGDGGDFVGAGFGLVAKTWPDLVDALLDSSLDGCVDDLGLDRAAASRIRRAFDDHRPLIERAPTVRSHGDLQPEHVILDLDLDAGSGTVRAIIDWADHGLADPAWDLAVLTLDDTGHLDALLEGYASLPTTIDVIRTRRTLYSVLRRVTEALWLAQHEYTDAATAALQHAARWRAPDLAQ